MGAVSDGQKQDEASAVPEEPVRLGMVGLQGHIDAIESGRVYGWAWNPEKATERVLVEIHVNGESVGSVAADRFRQDLADVGMGDGGHAFVFDLPPEARDADTASIAAYFCDSQMPLSRGGQNRPPTANGEPDPMGTLSGRIDRIEASVQQVFRALNVVRRGEDESSRMAGVQQLDGLHKKIAALAACHDALDRRLDAAEAATNAAHSFIERFDIEIHERIHRRELDDLRRELRTVKQLAGTALTIALLLAAALGYAALAVPFKVG